MPSFPSRLGLILTGALLLIACHRAPVVTKAPEAPAPVAGRADIEVQPTSGHAKFVAYGDIRFTSRWLREVSQPAARRALVKAIAGEKPDLVLISGDIPFRGAVASDWNVYENEIQPLKKARIPILPTLGNHEFYNRRLSTDRRDGITNFYAHFPNIPYRIERPWYSVRYADALIFVLDSADGDDTQAQIDWLKANLALAPDGIKNVFLLMHRPPYTDAADAGHRPRPQEQRIAAAVEVAQKAMPQVHFTVIAGHVHNYERFVHGGVTYIVSGGGGAAPRSLVRSSSDLFHPDTPNEIEFHYTVFKLEGDRLSFEMKRYDPVTGKFAVRDAYSLPE
jgi:acid phosphatase type 7